MGVQSSRRMGVQSFPGVESAELPEVGVQRFRRWRYRALGGWGYRALGGWGYKAPEEEGLLQSSGVGVFTELRRGGRSQSSGGGVGGNRSPEWGGGLLQSSGVGGGGNTELCNDGEFLDQLSYATEQVHGKKRIS